MGAIEVHGRYYGAQTARSSPPLRHRQRHHAQLIHAFGILKKRRLS